MMVNRLLIPLIVTAYVQCFGTTMQARADENSRSEEQPALKKATKVMPLQLIPPDVEEKIDSQMQAKYDKQTLTDLWAATVLHSDDLRFVKKHLKESGTTEAEYQALLKQVIAQSMSSPIEFHPAPGTDTIYSLPAPAVELDYPKQAGGGNHITIPNNGGLPFTPIGRAQKNTKARLTHEDQAVLFNIVRGASDRLVDCYHTYCKRIVEKKQLVDELPTAAFFSQPIDGEHFIKTLERALENVNEEICETRRELVKIAGVDAVDALDESNARLPAQVIENADCVSDFDQDNVFALWNSAAHWEDIQDLFPKSIFDKSFVGRFLMETICRSLYAHGKTNMLSQDCVPAGLSYSLTVPALEPKYPANLGGGTHVIQEKNGGLPYWSGTPHSEAHAATYKQQVEMINSIQSKADQLVAVYGKYKAARLGMPYSKELQASSSTIQADANREQRDGVALLDNESCRLELIKLTSPEAVTALDRNIDQYFGHTRQNSH